MAFDKYLKDKKYIIWDWNGTLLDDLVHTWQTGNRLLKQENMPEVSLKFYTDHFCFPVSEYYRKLKFDVDNKEYFKKLCYDFVGFYMEGVSGCSIKKEMKELIQDLSKKGFKQSILSAADQKNLETMVKQFGMTSYFDNVYGLADKEATCKITRGGTLIESIEGYKKSEMLIIGDTLHDLEVGETHGVDVVLVSHGHNSYERLVAKHDKVVNVHMSE